jgi:multidrug efflux pump subunit AcrB
VEVDQDRVLKQGLQFTEVYQTLQAFLGGAYVNQFNRFGRQWKVYLQAEPEYRTSADKINNFYVRNSKGDMTPLASLVTIKRVSGPEYTNRFNLYRSIQINGSPSTGFSSGQAMKAIATSEDGRDWARFGNLAINAWFDEVSAFVPQQGEHSGATVELKVQFRTKENNPYETA